MTVYIVNGYGGSGKTSFEDYVIDNSSKNGTKTSMVDMVKYYALQMGWRPGDKDNKDRRFLSDLKDALARWKDVPMNAVYGDIQLWELNNGDYIFIDAREKIDIARLKDICKNNEWICKTILIDREIQKDYGNHADDGVMESEYDITIMNTGTLEDFYRSAAAFIQSEGL